MKCLHWHTSTVKQKGTCPNWRTLQILLNISLRSPRTFVCFRRLSVIFGSGSCVQFAPNMFLRISMDWYRPHVLLTTRSRTTHAVRLVYAKHKLCVLCFFFVYFVHIVKLFLAVSAQLLFCYSYVRFILFRFSMTYAVIDKTLTVLFICGWLIQWNRLKDCISNNNHLIIDVKSKR